MMIITGPNMAGKSHLHAPGGPDRAAWRTWAALCPAAQAKIAAVRPDLHARGRLGRPRRGPVHLHGRDERDGLHPALCHAQEPADPGRDRARHLHVRRPVHRLGDRRVHPQGKAPRLQDALCHPLPRALRARRAAWRAWSTTSVTVRERGDEVIFLRKIQRGGADSSFGVQVAKPWPGCRRRVISRAREIMAKLEVNNVNGQTIGKNILGGDKGGRADLP